MVGRYIGDYYIHKKHARGPEKLRVEGLTRKGEFSDISFTAYAGEILSFAGLVGSGRTEVMETVFGARRPDSGKIFVNGKEVTFKSPKDAIDAGIGMVTEDRRRTGLMLRDTVLKNMVLPSIPMNSLRFGFLNSVWENDITKKMIKMLTIKTPSSETIVGNLSGGNQQKILLARWLVAHSDILILDEPTRGIDVNAKSEFYALMNDFLDKGGCIIVVSSEMPEVIGISDRVLVMREGRISGELTGDEITEHNIITLASS
jgi:monosaccharide ABC transporter ATP-binding protein, CUT2 family (TC 3.A.1.2.-)